MGFPVGFELLKIRECEQIQISNLLDSNDGCAKLDTCHAHQQLCLKAASQKDASCPANLSAFVEFINRNILPKWQKNISETTASRKDECTDKPGQFEL